MHDMKMTSRDTAKFTFLVCFQCGGGGRTRTYEGIASGFTVRPLCRSGHSPEAVAPDLEDIRLRPPAGRDLPVLWGDAPVKSMEAIPPAADQLRHP